MAAPTPEAWKQNLALLLDNQNECRRMAIAAQEELLAGNMLSDGIGRYLALWRRAAKIY